MKYVLFAAFSLCAWGSAALSADLSPVAVPPEKIEFDFTDFPKPGPTETYKGRLLVGSRYKGANNRVFISYTKKAIDLTEELPQALQRGIRLINVIIYDPPGPEKDKASKRADSPNKAITNMFAGIYTYGSDLYKPAPMIVERDVTWISPILIGYALVDASLYARLHRNVIVLGRQIKKHDKTSEKYKMFKKKLNLLVTLAKASDLKVVRKHQCKFMRVHFAAMKVWKEAPQKLDQMMRQLNENKCLK